jgi:hypothetical protein
MPLQRMEPIIKESGRSARIEKRFHNRMLRVELTESALNFCPMLLGVIKCGDLLTLPVGEIQSVRRVNERGVDSFEVNAQGKRKLCWFDTLVADEWEQAFSSVGVVVEHAPDPVPQNSGDA